MRDEHGPDDVEEVVRTAAPRVLAALVRRGDDFASAEDAVQDAIVEALRVWPDHRPREPVAWLTTVATRRLIDARRSDSARQRRELVTAQQPAAGLTEEGDDTLLLLFQCCHPALSPASQVALTLRAVAGLTTREIADVFFVPEATMAQRISRAKAALRESDFHEPGDLAVVLRVLSLVYHTGHGRRPELTTDAIRLARQLTHETDEPEARGLLALLMLQHARLPARIDAAGRFVPLDEQDRSLWITDDIATAVELLQSALTEMRHGRFQILAAIAALHADARIYDETDWPQILDWYDELVALSDTPEVDDPAAVLNRAVAVGHVIGAGAGLAETDRVVEALGQQQQWYAVRAYLLEMAGELAAAGRAYSEAAQRSRQVAERDHLVRRAAAVNWRSRRG